MFTTPFNPIIGNGLGVSYSSLNQIGSIFPQQGIGQANIQCYVNMQSGNLIIKDLMVKLIELNGPMELGFYFNAQVGANSPNWQFAIKKLTYLPDGQTAILQEEDGHLTTYTIGNNNTYTAPGLNDGIPYLTKLNDGTIQWYHPKTQITEIYSAKGLLQSRTNAKGNTTNYNYDASGNLTNINGPSGDTYQISRTSTNIYIYDTSTGNKNLLQSYTIDSQGRITSTQTPDGYQVSYFYGSSIYGTVLNKITQSDGTVIQFNTNAVAQYGNQVMGFRLGTDVTFSFTYPSAQNSNIATIKDGVSSLTSIKLDQNNRASQITQQTGYDVLGSEVDTTTITYNPAGQVQSITKPEGQLNNQSTVFQYGNFGLITQRTDPNGQITQFNYYNDENCAVPTYLISKTRLLNNQALTTYYVYDTNYDTYNHLFQRFAISPCGRVTQYQPDVDGNIEYISQFFNAVFNTANLVPTTPVSLGQLSTWAAQQFAQGLLNQVSLTNCEYNTRGQVASKVQFANTDGQGKGVSDQFSSYYYNNWDEFGNLTQNEFLQVYPTTMATTTQRFDGLQRLTTKVDALFEKTTYNYLDSQSQIQMIYPNNSTDTKTLEPSGLVSLDTQVAINNNQNQTRNTSFARDTAGHVIKTTLPDGNLVYTFYDRQNRLGIKITPMGIITQTKYNRIYNYKSVTTYANSIVTSQLVNPINPNILPNASLALSLLKTDSLNDQTSYEFKDASNRVIWEVDSGNYGTQTLYDSLNRPIAKITYSNQLTSAELNQLLVGKAVNRTPDFTIDKARQYFYDNDGKRIGKAKTAGYFISSANNDPTGYITQYFRDSAGRVYKKTRYATKVNLNFNYTNLNQILPQPDPANDATTFTFRDARGNPIAIVDAGNAQGRYLTLITNLPCGLPAQSVRYATPIDPNWINNPITIPATPASSTEDLTTVFDYDLLNRVVQKIGAMNREDFTHYDNMGNIYSEQTNDGNNPSSIDPACMRGTQTLFDGWNQKTAEANPYVNQLLSAPNLTPEQIALIWQTQSMRHVYDTTGLKLYTIMPPRQNSTTNDIYFTYYDADRRPFITIDPTGAIIESTLNSFNKPTQIRKYANRISQADLAELTGGFITPTVRGLLNGLQNAKDEISATQYDQRSLVKQYTDPNGNVTTKSYTAFKQVASENLPVANQQPSMSNTYIYESRGGVVQATKTGGAISITTSSLYLSLYGKRTLFIDELNTQHIKQYDNLGAEILYRKDSVSDGLNFIYRIYTRDAFSRKLIETDSLQNVTTHIYNQQLRTHKITYPISTTFKTITLNIFNTKNQIADSYSKTEKWTYAPDGKVATYTDQLEFTTTDNHDLVGRNYLHIDAIGTQYSKIYDGASHILTSIDDAATTGLQLTTQFVVDAYGNNLFITDPRNTKTANIFDPCDNLTESVIDPNNPQQNYTGLNIIKRTTYNAQKIATGYKLGDASKKDQYDETYPIDDINRPTGKIVDPKGLNIATANVLNNASLVIAEQDGNGNYLRIFYDGLKRKRFVIDQEGRVYERNYNTENRLSYERKYDQKINLSQLSNQTTLQQLLGMVQTLASTQDSYKYYFYDSNLNERFTVNSVSKVCEKRFDNNDREILSIEYGVGNLATVTTLTTAALVTWAAQNANCATNRNEYKMLDAKGQRCFVINPNNIISMAEYDPNGKIITTATFANPVVPSQIIVLQLNQVLASIKQDATLDRYNYKILDALKRLIFEVDGKGTVIGHWYDGNNNEEINAIYKQQIIVPQSYNNIVTAVKALPAPTQVNSSMKQKVWDNANRVTKVTDPLGYFDEFLRDASGNIKVHTDRNKNQWINEHDRANRITDQFTPSVPVTVVTAAPQSQSTKTTLSSEKGQFKLLAEGAKDGQNIETKILADKKKPRYPTINITGISQNAGLFALALATKKALLKNPEMQKDILHWPLIIQADEADIKNNKSKINKICHYLRIALVKAVSESKAFKKQTYANFLNNSVDYLQKGRFTHKTSPLDAIVAGNMDFFHTLANNWKNIIGAVANTKMENIAVSLLKPEISDKEVRTLFQDISQILPEITLDNKPGMLSRLFAKFTAEQNDIITAILKFYKLLSCVRRIKAEKIELLSAINSFYDDLQIYIEKMLFQEINKTTVLSEKIHSLLVYSLHKSCEFDNNGNLIKRAKNAEINDAFMQVFTAFTIDTKGGWDNIYLRYCQHLEKSVSAISAEEIACLATFWQIDANIMFNDGKYLQNYNKPNQDKLRVQLINSNCLNWQVVDLTSDTISNSNSLLTPQELAEKVEANDSINNTPAASQIVLSATQTRQKIQTHFVYDKNGNKTQIVKGFGTPQAKTINLSYTPTNLPQGTLINNVPVDNPNLDASYTTRPETLQNISTAIIYNGKKKKVVEQNESGACTFYVYDSEEREVYRVFQNTITNGSTTVNKSAVIQKTPDLFNNIVQETSYATPINLDLTQYIQTGIPLSVIQQAGVIQTSQNDRTSTKTFDNKNNLTFLQQGPIFYYLPNANNGQPQFGENYMQTKFQYSAFDQCYCKSVLLNPVQNTWSQQLYWFDRSGNTLGECDPVYRVKIRQYDAFDNELFRNEWANPPSVLPDSNTILSDLIKAYSWSPKDRVYSFIYDVRQSKLSETRAQQLTANTVGVNISSLSFNNSIPVITPQTVSGLSKNYTYSPTEKLISIQDEAQNISYIFYDGRNIPIAHTGVPRTSIDQNNNPITLVPLEYIGNDLFGKAVSKTRFKQGTTKVTNSSQLPVPIATDPDDQTEMTLFDIRSQAMWKQDASNYVQGYTYTPTRKKARVWYQLTNHTAIHLDETRFDFDLLDQLILRSQYRDGILATNLQRQIQYDLFNQAINEGTNDGTFFITRYFDSVGNKWLSNDKNGIATLTIPDLRKKITLSAQSESIDLMPTNYNNLNTFFTDATYKTVELVQNERDSIGRTIGKDLVSYEIPNPQGAKELPLTLIVTNAMFGKTSISWLRPVETNVFAPQIELIEKYSGHYSQFINIVNQGKMSTVDVSSLSSDVYDYKIKYYLKHGDSKQPGNKHIYEAKGTLQFQAYQTTNSKSLVVFVYDDNILYITGNTYQLDALQLMQNGKQIAQVAVNPITNSTDFNADLSSYPSGVYTAIPVFGGKNDFPQTLPFTIYTATPSLTPLSREIHCDAKLLTLFQGGIQHAQLIWEVPKPFDKLPITMTCVYTDNNNNTKTQQVNITPGTNLGVYTDSQGNKLTCNNNFAYQITQIQTLTIALQLSATESIIILNGFVPSKVSGDNIQIILEDKFAHSHVEYISPLLGFTSPPTINYLDTTQDRQAKPKPLTAIQATSNGIVLDVTSFEEGYFPYTLVMPDKSIITSTFSVSSNHEVLYPAKHETVPPPVIANPKYQFGLDNWNNIISKTDTRGNTTLYDIGIDNQCTLMTQPPVDVLNSDGTITPNVNPKTIKSVDILSNTIGITDPNGNTEGFKRDEAGQLLQDILGDGTLANGQVLDALSRITIRTDSRGKKYALIYDHKNNVIQETYPSGKIWTFGNNEINRRYVQTDSNSPPQSIFYDYDVDKNISQRYLPLGQVTSMIYERNRKPILINYSDGTSQSWNLDDVGDPVTTPGIAGHIDIGGVSYFYTMDYKRQVKTKKSSVPSVQAHGQIINISAAADGIWHNGNYYADIKYTLNAVAPIAQDLEFKYSRGLVIEAKDKANGTATLNEWDSERRKVSYQLLEDNGFGNNPWVIVSELNTEYDNISRETTSYGTQGIVKKWYDANDDIIRQKVEVYSESDDVIEADGWSTVDTASRVLLYNAHFDKNTQKIELKNGIGNQYIYQNGVRYQQIYIDDLGTHTTTLTYDDDCNLLTASTSPDGILATRGYDLVNRPNSYSQNGPLAQSSSTIYNFNGWITNADQTPPPPASGPTISQSTVFGPNFMPDGQPCSQVTTYSNGIVDTFDGIYYGGFDDIELTSMVGTRYVPKQGTGKVSTCNRYLDSNGNVMGQNGVWCDSGFDSFGAKPGSIYLVTSYEGQVLQRYELIGANVGVGTVTYDITTYFYDAGDTAVAEYTQSYEAYSELLKPKPGKVFKPATVAELIKELRSGAKVERLGTGPIKYHTPKLSALPTVTRAGTVLTSFNQQLMGGSYIKGIPTNTLNQISSFRFGNRSFSNSVQAMLKNTYYEMLVSQQLEQNGLDIVHPIDQSYPPAMPSIYITQQGDNLENIAAVQGDSNIASAISNINCVSNNTILQGMQLTIPQQIQNQNQAGTSLPYSRFMNTILMAMYPEMKVNPPKVHETWVAETIHTIVDVGATIIGYALGTMLGGIGGPLVSALLTGLADAAYQELAVEEDWQRSFSLENSVLAGIEAGIQMAVVGANLPGLNLAGNVPPLSSYISSMLLKDGLSMASTELITAVADAGAIATLDQLTEMSLGLVNKFNFNEVLSAMATAAAVEQVTSVEKVAFSVLPNPDQVPEDLVDNLTGGLIQTTTDAIFEGGDYTWQSLQINMVTAGALGATLGQDAGEEIVSLVAIHLSATNPNNNVNNANGNKNKSNAIGSGAGINSNDEIDNPSSDNPIVTPGNTGGIATAGSSQIGVNGSSSQSSSGSSTDITATTSGNAKNPGSNLNGFFSSGNNGNTSFFGSGNGGPTSKSTIDISDESINNNSQINWLTTNPSDLNQFAPGLPSLLNNSIFAGIQANSYLPNLTINTRTSLTNNINVNNLVAIMQMWMYNPEPIIAIGLSNIIPYTANVIQNYVAEHGSISVDVSAGYGVAGDFEVGISKQGVTTFFGIGAGVGIDVSSSANYDFQDTSGFTSKTSISTSLDVVPIQGSASVMVSQTGPAFSADLQTGEGFEIESVLGYTKTYTWDQIENSVRRISP